MYGMRSKTTRQSKDMIYVKIHATGERGNHRFVIAVCDKDLIGKTIKGKGVEIHASEHFYKGELKSEADILALLPDGSNINFLGEKAVAVGIKSGVISKGNVIMIGSVPHAQAVSF